MKNIIKFVALSCIPVLMLFSILFVAGCTESSKTQVSKELPAQLDLSGRRSISSDELQQVISKGEKIVTLDVRSAGEYEGGHIPGSVNISYDRVVDSPADVPGRNDKAVVVYCESGYRSSKAQRALLKAGFACVLHLEGDMMEWRSNGLPLEVD